MTHNKSRNVALMSPPEMHNHRKHNTLTDKMKRRIEAEENDHCSKRMQFVADLIRHTRSVNPTPNDSRDIKKVESHKRVSDVQPLVQVANPPEQEEKNHDMKHAVSSSHALNSNSHGESVTSVLEDDLRDALLWLKDMHNEHDEYEDSVDDRLLSASPLEESDLEEVNQASLEVNVLHSDESKLDMLQALKTWRRSSSDVNSGRNAQLDSISLEENTPALEKPPRLEQTNKEPPSFTAVPQRRRGMLPLHRMSKTKRALYHSK